MSNVVENLSLAFSDRVRRFLTGATAAPVEAVEMGSMEAGIVGNLMALKAGNFEGMLMSNLKLIELLVPFYTTSAQETGKES